MLSTKTIVEPVRLLRFQMNNIRSIDDEWLKPCVGQDLLEQLNQNSFLIKPSDLKHCQEYLKESVYDPPLAITTIIRYSGIGGGGSSGVVIGTNGSGVTTFSGSVGGGGSASIGGTTNKVHLNETLYLKIIREKLIKISVEINGLFIVHTEIIKPLNRKCDFNIDQCVFGTAMETINAIKKFLTKFKSRFEYE